MSIEKSDYKSTFGKRLQVLRKKVGLTQQELAFRADMAKDTLSRYERGLLMPTVEAFVNIYNALSGEDRELTADDILFADTESSKVVYKVGNFGSLVGLKFMAGGMAEVQIRRTDICKILQVIRHHEYEKETPNERIVQIIIELLEYLYEGSDISILADVVIAMHKVKLEPVIPKFEDQQRPEDYVDIRKHSDKWRKFQTEDDLDDKEK